MWAQKINVLQRWGVAISTLNVHLN